MEGSGRSFNHLIRAPYNKQMPPTNFPLRSKSAADLRRSVHNYMLIRWTVYLALLAVVTCGLDLLSTYHVAPDLKGEANPVAAVMGTSWSTLYVIKSVCCFVATLFFYFGFRIIRTRAKRLAGIEGCLNILSHLFYKRSVTFFTMVIGAWPKDWSATLAFYGICFATSIVCGSFLASAANVLRLISSPKDLTVFYISSGVVSVVGTCYLVCRFIIDSQKTEQMNPEGAPGADAPSVP
jgi:hypothetical protein